ncbi:hypothetical protein B0H63DRAFT_493656 [Podospora didyma]|uniref:ER-bound oxygenase mpaB/mpaB'/Rubber oxygenase catalytic domain-containing protein n=1 Tax=Podospora didyma TaxID=330526 RepID=A0AAE0NTB0_9PEZI|nr:hypothetical protein B0H63DRAFT_493656 [Podospora didyma]
MGSSNRGWTYGFVGIFSYALVIRLLRFRLRNSLLRKHNYLNRRAMNSMTLEEAYEIQKDITELEFPFTFYNATSFALFKTYAIPTISKLLMNTGQLSKTENASNRAADTAVLVTEYTFNPPASDRAVDSIARMNYLHQGYRKAGTISDDDLLYTLALFALEKIRWTDRFEWRTVTPLEKCAIGVFYRHLGYAMEIPFDVLNPYLPKGPNGKVLPDEEIDGLTWLEALDAWSRQYELDFMVPAQSNKDLAQYTLDVFLIKLPKSVVPFATKVVSALLEPRVRTAMMLVQPGPIHTLLLKTTLTLRRWALMYLLPPRPGWLRVEYFTKTADPKTGRYYSTFYHVAHPWYMKPTFWSRWGPSALLVRLTGGYIPGEASPEAVANENWHSEGYRIQDVGPKNKRGKGEAEMAAMRDRLLENYKGAGPAGRCPMTLG